MKKQIIVEEDDELTAFVKRLNALETYYAESRYIDDVMPYIYRDKINKALEHVERYYPGRVVYDEQHDMWVVSKRG